VLAVFLAAGGCVGCVLIIGGCSCVYQTWLQLHVLAVFFVGGMLAVFFIGGCGCINQM